MPLRALWVLLSVSLGCVPSEAPVAGVYRLEVVVPGSPFHGIHGLTFDDQDRLYAGGVTDRTTYLVDPESGDVSVHLGPPEGTADDLEFGPGGQMVWTSPFAGKVRSQRPGEPRKVLASGLPAINAVAWNAEGRLFVSEVFGGGDALWEIDPEGEREPRLVLENLGGLNGFDFGPDGKLYGAIWYRGEVARIDVDAETMETVAGDFHTPAAANFDSKGRLWVLDTGRGHVVRVDVDSGSKTVVAELQTGLDNLAFDSQDRLFVSNMADNGIYEVDTETGEVRTVVEGALGVPAGLEIVDEGDGEMLHVADTYAYRIVDPVTGEVRDIARIYGDDIENPLEISVGERSVLFAFFFRGLVQVFDRATREVQDLHLDTPGNVLFLDPERFLVTDVVGGRLLEIDLPRALSEESPADATREILSGLGEPVGLVAAGVGSVYVSEASTGIVSEIDIMSGEKRIIAADLQQPEGIAVLPDGNLVVAEVGARALVRIDTVSGERTELAADLPIGLEPPDGVPLSFIPTGVTVSAAGEIYFSSDLETAIYRLVPSDG